MKFGSGFTLFELAVVFTIIAILVAGVGFLGIQAVRNQEFGRARQTIWRELTTARLDTIAGTQDAPWGVAFFSDHIVRFQGANYAARNTVYDAVTTFGGSVSISGVSQIDFTRPDGVPSAAGTSTVRDETHMSNISVNAAGTIQVQ